MGCGAVGLLVDWMAVGHCGGAGALVMLETLRVTNERGCLGH